MEALLQHFHEVVTTAADVEQLKKFILRLAFQGKLVEQDLNDEPVSALLERIEDEKKQLVLEKRIKREKLSPSVTQEEQPYEIPLHWNWVRLGRIGDWGAGATPSRSNSEFYNGEIPWIKTGELNDGYINSSEETITELALSKASLRLNKPGDVLIAMYGATIGKLGILEIEATTNQACCACTPYEGVLNQYLFYYLLSQRDDFRNQGTGGAQPNISRTKIIQSVFPLAPYKEQMRIVRRIQDLFSVCDTLKDEIRQIELTSASMNKSVFTRIQDYNNHSQLEDLQFVIGNIEHLCNTKEDIELLRNSILSLAMQGKLVEQNPSNESATLLLQKVREERVRLVAEKKVRKEKELEPITPTEIPYELPNGWTWSRIGEVYTTVSGSTPSRAVTSYFKGGTIHWVKTTDLNNGVVQACEENITEKAVQDAKLKILPPQTVCIAMYGGAGTIGKSGIFNFYSTINQSICALLPNQFMNPYYLHYYILSVRKEWMRFASSTRKDPNINRDIIKMFLIPVPPLEEQKCIAEKVGRLMTLCDELEKNIEQSQLKSEKSLKAVLQETVTVKEEVLK